jgi:WD40 repeat protein
MPSRSFIPETGLDTEHLRIYIDRIDSSIEDDPSLAIGSTKELIEATLKTVLNGCSFEFDDKKEDIPKLLKKVQKVLELLPDDVDESKKGADIIKRVLNNLGSVAVGIAELRNFYGSGHGKGQMIQGITSRHARLVVSSGTALCSFLLETYEHRERLNLEHLRSEIPKHLRVLSFKPIKQVSCVAVHPDNQILASGDEDHKVRIWDLATGKVLHEYTRYYHDKYSGDVNALTFSQDGRFLITAGFVSGSRSLQDVKQKKIQILNWKTGELVDYLPNSSRFENTCTVVLCANSNVIAFDSNNRIELYDFSLRTSIKTLEGHLTQVRSIAFSPNGEMLVSSDEDGQVRAWKWQKSDLSEIYLKIASSVNTITINSENHFMAIGSEDRKIIIFDLISKKVSIELDGHMDAVNSLAFSPNGQILASGSRDDTVKLWHVKTGKLLDTIECNSCWKNVLSVSFSPDGQTLAAGLAGGEIKTWQRGS